MKKVQRRIHRVCSSLAPPVRALRALADSADIEPVLALEALTDPLAKTVRDAISTIPIVDRYTGSFGPEIMTPFVLPSPSRFSDGSYGVLYAAEALRTAIAERRFHYQRWLAQANTPATLLPVLALCASYRGVTHDATTLSGPLAAAIYDPDPARYAAAQGYGSRVRSNGAEALRYRSVRDRDGVCFGVFRPAAIRGVDLEAHLRYEWDGKAVVDVLESIGPG